MKRTWKALLALILALALCLPLLPAAFAADAETLSDDAPIGRTFQTAFEPTYGKEYSNYWTPDNDHLCFYIKVTLPARGKLDFYFTKPTDAEGEYGRLEMTLYGGDGSLKIWEETCRHTQYNASDRYSFTLGLDAGVYYFAVKPHFTVTSGIIKTDFSFSFSATDLYEVEPNGSGSQATVIRDGELYGASITDDDEDDYFRFATKEGKSYKIYFGNYAQIDASSIIIRVLAPDGSRCYLKDNYDDKGDYKYLSDAVGGNYLVRIYNYYGGPINYTVSIFEDGKNYDPPAIVTQPKAKTVFDGAKAEFTVEASGDELSYQWQYRTSSSGAWKNATGTGNQTATLKVSATLKKSGYQYRCIVTNDRGSATSKAVKLTVKAVSKPTITTQPKKASVNKGATATFTVKATGQNLSYQWQYRTSSSGTWKNATATGNKTATLKVEATAKKNGYQYRCKVKNAAGTVTTNAVTLTVKTIAKPTVKTQPKSVTVKKGTEVTFTVTATGKNLSYQWQYRASSSGTWKNSTSTGSKTATLTIQATAKRNGYQYRCIITNSGGKVTSKAATLTVK